jgi:DNA-binding winged helix-turn-helix (wHTH) protein/predicted ATPase
MSEFLFESFRLDPVNARLWRGSQALALTPKAFAVLHYLVRHAGQLVTKEALFNAVWPDTAVSEAVLRVCMMEIRKVLDETAKTPRVIATVHRRGYRFLASITAAESPPVAPEGAAVLPDTATLAASPPPALLVEREAVLQQLHIRLAEVFQGRRQVIFVTGEPGIGKTSVVEAFTTQVTAATRVRIAWGQCVEYYGVGEAYLPVLEALGQLCRGPAGTEVVAVLRHQAPTWLVQMPWLLNQQDRETLQHEIQGSTRERMLRELAEALATLTATVPLVLVLEDLHWSDHATLDLLTILAWRRDFACLLLVGTYRPVDAMIRAQPLRAITQDLRLHGLAIELPLSLLSVAAVHTYLATRFPGNAFPAALAQRLYERTEGNPLFVVKVLDQLVSQGTVVEHNGRWTFQGQVAALEVGIPESLQQMLGEQLDRLTPIEQRVLEAGSVAGAEFTVAAVAAGLEETIAQVDGCCEALWRRGEVLRATGVVVWPDGTVTARYAFQHALYQQMAYQRLGVTQRVYLHRRIGMRLEGAFGRRAGEIAAELAVHFTHGRDDQRAVQYLRYAAETAGHRHAHREAIEYLRQALGLLQAMPETPQVLQQELAAQLALGPALMVTRGFAAPEVADTYVRARQLCEQLGDRQQLFPVLVGLWRSAHVRGQLQTARALGEQLLSLANRQDDPTLFVAAHGPLGQTLCIHGELRLARAHLQQAVASYKPHRQRALALRFGYDPGLYACAMEGWVLWLLGYPAQALQRSYDALTLAQAQAHPFTLSLTLATVAILQHMRREGEAALEHVQASLALSTEHGFPYLIAVGTVLQGWELTRVGQIAEGMTQIRQGLAALRATGAELLRPYLLALLAEAYESGAQIEAGLGALQEALIAAETHTERFYVAELRRLQGELILQQCVEADSIPAPQEIQHGQVAVGGATSQLPLQMEAEACFQSALAIAQHQGAKSLELRAALSLSRLWRQQDKWAAAQQLLRESYGWFTEGFDTADLHEAKALLEELAGV